ncbi:glycerophosphodiester phosphodiesterase family protein [Pseudoruegeria sp. HB172150]|uniref:glycerophosphodiester phosphodiesterase family protein n=1 Tax=Pseudoruegeria sp. HB172150 TaxID=2721164 RepID=UPI00155214D9|nr:glycerophosphodiester phosphodiesterase family protein [Pseudoruegeria sp. HB172150]
MTALPAAFLGAPITHRGYHGAGVPENSPASFEAAIAAGYGIEMDIQLSSDGGAMVFHDYELDRLTSESGLVRDRSTADLAQITLANGEPIPTLSTVLSQVNGRTPLLIEIKDQDGVLGPDVGPLEQAVAAALDGYTGPVAVMAFNPHSIAAFAKASPGTPIGLTTCPYRAEDWPGIPQGRLDELNAIPDYDRTGASFISHQHSGLAMPRVADLKAHGARILCWTVRNPADEAEARKIADNITFEGYAAAIP